MKTKEKKKQASSQGLVPKLRFPEFLDTGAWEEKQLDEIATFHKGKGISKADIDPQGETPCLRYGELYTCYQEEIKSVVSKTNMPAKDFFLSCRNDVIIPSSGETKIDIATASCLLLDDVAIGGDINVVRCNQNGRFLSYYLNGWKKFEIAKIAQGDTVVHLYINQLKLLNIDIPKPEEQQKIADCLSSLDELIAAQAHKLDTLKAHKKGLMQQLFPAPGQNTPTLRFPEFQDAGEWKEQRIEKLAKRGSGHTPNKKKSSYYNGGIKWVSLADSSMLDNGYIFETKTEISEEGIKNSSATLHPRGAVIISRDAGVGKSAILHSEMAVSHHFIAWVWDQSKLWNWFLYYSIPSPLSSLFFPMNPS